MKDQAERTRAIEERTRNVIVDAGAGTGKTTLLVARLLHLVAPADGGPALQLERIAAITFTRKAAGELKLRLREKLLEEAQHAQGPRRERLRAALDSLDNALISTVHSFADRLLRMRPLDAKLSPEYAIAEDPTPYIDETFAWLLDASSRGSLAAGLQEALGRAEEAVETLRIYQASGLLQRTQELENYARLGLDAFVEDVVQSRDRPLADPELPPIDWATVERCADELRRDAVALRPTSAGARTVLDLSERARSLHVRGNLPESIRRTVSWRSEYRFLANLKKGADFAGDNQAWDVRRWLHEGKRGRNDERPGGPLARALTEPVMAHVARRLVRLRPVILERYRLVKRAHGVLDQIDLLVALRDLLQHDPDARAFYQARFDHLLVDEFQDTDPVQAEIILHLCQGSDGVELAPGKLTVVGDPKQSIYRFRRADIGMYAEVCERIQRGPVCKAELSVNFRSAPILLDWFNRGFDSVLGVREGEALDRAQGSVANRHLHPANIVNPAAAVHVLPFGEPELKADDSRNVEGAALAQYIRYLIEESALTIRDPRSGALRRPHYGDVAVMMISTQTVHHLTSELDRLGVPHVVRGGTLFMQDPLHRQFVLGLRALSDPGDGVARAALLRPPFFALTLEDLLRGEKAAADASISSLRLLRHQVTPGELARRVLETTGFGAYVAAGVNGPQRLARLYELCLHLDELAHELRLDFDGISALARGWIETPTRIEAPLPIDADAVQVITAHQAKGLEWPIVALWDGRAKWTAYLPPVSLAVDGASGGWALKLDGLEYDPTDRGLQQRELELRKQERKRVVYVAATRARDVLILPEAGGARDEFIPGRLLNSAAAHRRVEARESRAVSQHPPVALQRAQIDAWPSLAHAAAAPRLVPAGVRSVSHAVRAHDAEQSEPRKPREGRHGAAFGTAVHRALELTLSGTKRERACERACQELSYPAQALVLEDVERAHAALAEAGLLESTLRLEYPIAGSLEPSTLVAGYIDLLAFDDHSLTVIDFKTDAPGAYPEYFAQVRSYVELLRASGAAGQRALRGALLFTGDGSLHWLER